MSAKNCETLNEYNKHMVYTLYSSRFIRDVFPLLEIQRAN